MTEASQKNTLACIDLGSNSFRLLVTRLSANGELVELDTYKDSIRLAGTIGDDAKIPEDIIEKLTPLMEREDFQPAAIKKTSIACEAMCMWVHLKIISVPHFY